jgi:hypothetical protein
MAAKHWYAMELAGDSVKIHRFNNKRLIWDYALKSDNFMRYVGSTHRYVVAAIKAHKQGKEWPISVNQN